MKPLGYAGDYQMVNMMLNAPIEGANLYAKIVNAWCLHQGAPAAHRKRIDMLIEHLVNESRRAKQTGKRLRVMNIGCGPAVEIQRFIRESELSENCDFQLMDFNDETIAYTDARIKAAMRESGRHANITFVHKSVDELLKEVAGLRGEQNRDIYDYVYCAGLFDYLSDRTCKRLLQHFVNWTVPGGLVVATNVHSSNPVRYFMEHIMEWHLIYRDETRMQALATGGTLRRDSTGFNIFLEIRKGGSVVTGGA
jgi:extracellular factor (EF) 3-hydroxypalmitic acid methyl ester biosynthesis protein